MREREREQSKQNLLNFLKAKTIPLATQHEKLPNQTQEQKINK